MGWDGIEGKGREGTGGTDRAGLQTKILNRETEREVLLQACFTCREKKRIANVATNVRPSSLGQGKC